MAARNPRFWPVVSAIAGALIVIVALPDGVKQGWAPSFLKPGFHLGLDLAGGTQLDFRISESEIQQQLADIDRQMRELEAQGGHAQQSALFQTENVF